MLKVLINRKSIEGPGGGGYSWLRAFEEYAPKFGVQPVHQFLPTIDAMFLFDPRYDDLGISMNEMHSWKQKYPQIKVIHRINECDLRNDGANNIDGMLCYSSTFADRAIFVSKWVQDLHIASGYWRCSSNGVIHNGVNKLSFRPLNKKNNGKVNIVVSHWSNNRKKGAVEYEFIDKFVAKNQYKYSFTYIGRHSCEFSATEVLPPMTSTELANTLGTFDVCINTSRHDPGPNSVLETISSGVSTYVHEFGGGAVELAGSKHVVKNTKDIEELLIAGQFEKNEYIPMGWEQSIEKYCDEIKNCLKS